MCIETKPHQLGLQPSFDHCRERWNICGGKKLLPDAFRNYNFAAIEFWRRSN
jgi:hypothetical protein